MHHKSWGMCDYVSLTGSAKHVRCAGIFLNHTIPDVWPQASRQFAHVPVRATVEPVGPIGPENEIHPKVKHKLITVQRSKLQMTATITFPSFWMSIGCPGSKATKPPGLTQV